MVAAALKVVGADVGGAVGDILTGIGWLLILAWLAAVGAAERSGVGRSAWLAPNAGWGTAAY